MGIIKINWRNGASEVFICHKIPEHQTKTKCESLIIGLNRYDPENKAINELQEYYYEHFDTYFTFKGNHITSTTTSAVPQSPVPPSPSLYIQQQHVNTTTTETTTIATTSKAAVPHLQQSSTLLSSQSSKIFNYNEIVVICDYSFYSLIGRGNSSVYKGFFNNNGCAIKQFSGDNRFIKFNHEMHILELIGGNKCPYLVKVFGINDPNVSPKIVFEECITSLTELIKETVVDADTNKYSFIPIIPRDLYITTNFKKLILAKSIAEGMKNIHYNKPSIIHRDLKGCNILIRRNGSCCIGDFGNSQEYSDENKEMVPVGTFGFIAPESMWNDSETSVKNITPKSDVFSYGMLVYIIFELKTNPFAQELEKESERTISRKVKEENLRPIFIKTPHLIQNLIMQCWKSNPLDRPSFKKIVKSLKKLFVDEKDNISKKPQKQK